MEQSYKEKYEQAIERLKQWDREHPCAGYVLSDRDKFIFPELAESEGEKIKKRITLCLEECVHSDVIRDYEKDECIAWLEKQGDYANFRDKAQVGDRITKNEDGVLVNLSQLKRVAKPRENKGNIEGISPNWSEEDEDYLFLLNSICKDAEEKYRNSPDVLVRKEIANARNWLQSLKGRVQPKQEWSEDDEQHIDSLLKRLDALCRNKFERTRFAISEDRDWLKSLRPQNRWKPSDEQIGLLQAIINEPKNAASESCQIVLKDILEQLKKLKEGKV